MVKWQNNKTERRNGIAEWRSTIGCINVLMLHYQYGMALCYTIIEVCYPQNISLQYVTRTHLECYVLPFHIIDTVYYPVALTLQ